MKCKFSFINITSNKILQKTTSESFTLKKNLETNKHGQI